MATAAPATFIGGAGGDVLLPTGEILFLSLRSSDAATAARAELSLYRVIDRRQARRRPPQQQVALVSIRPADFVARHLSAAAAFGRWGHTLHSNNNNSINSADLRAAARRRRTSEQSAPSLRFSRLIKSRFACARIPLAARQTFSRPVSRGSPCPSLAAHFLRDSDQVRGGGELRVCSRAPRLFKAQSGRREAH